MSHWSSRVAFFCHKLFRNIAAKIAMLTSSIQLTRKNRLIQGLSLIDLLNYRSQLIAASNRPYDNANSV